MKALGYPGRGTFSNWIGELCPEIGKRMVGRPLLYNWKSQLLGREVPASMRRQKKPAPNLERAELEQQVESLRRDIRKLELELERDILKKANEPVKKGWASTRIS